MPLRIGSIDVLHTSLLPLGLEKANYEGPKPGVTTLPKGFKKSSEHRGFNAPTIYERDVAIPLRDGTNLIGDVFRPANVTDKVPIILAYSPYGKTGQGFADIDISPYHAGVPPNTLSGFQSFEAPDPAVWTAFGYAIVNVDARGIFKSGGEHRWFGTAEGRDGYDTVEYLSQLSWCNGRVALMGNSWLAGCQWFIGAERPPHLTAIMPLEGVSDLYRESLCRGGVPWKLFWQWLGSETFFGENGGEDVIAMIDQYPLMNEYWEDKRAKSHLIQVPAYVLASMSSSLHTVGSTRSYEDIPHAKKWLRIHPTQEWYDLYQEDSILDFKKFLDFYMKDIQNDWEQTPKVRVSVLRYNQDPIVNVPFFSWPVPEAVYRSLYLQDKGQLSSNTTAAEPIRTVSYQSDIPVLGMDADSEEAEFRITFHETTTLIGASKAILYMSSLDNDDMDVFVQIRKTDKSGKVLRHSNLPIAELCQPADQDKDLFNVLQYTGPTGILRASHRALDPVLSKPHWPAHDHSREVRIAPGEIVKMEIGLWVSAMQFEAGEQLVFKVAGHHMLLAEFADTRGKFANRNKGRHVLHFGGQYNSHIEVPLITGALG
ncbi:hypothetical protein sscle_04g037400 [Sclerotinia sclerotiorum 1980 UF-70]|uniref:Xaa-Pro dipeptidyl-peptidase C-terminal domain-containing protein n=1 Tax=Sclerotinia sclerotiorum (strain ATCC 18683 / 1980 / Ss-1) TaxID=665079 RepID=A0A1D9Q1Z4_SCLS1|nr:hypothetical protein sscle_04g037400 [Sclerotinia sclerotiorum 1980 UF-70]